MEKAGLIILPVLALLVLIAALMNRLPPNAAVIGPALALLGMVFIAYRTSLRGPQVRLEPMPVDGFKHSVPGGYSNGMPSTWQIAVRLLATNDSPQTGYLTRFAVDIGDLEHHSRKPGAFSITFSGLESRVSSSTTLPATLPVILQPRASQDLLFRANLTFNSGPADLANDLRELCGFRVSYRYSVGKVGKEKQRAGTVTVSYDQLRKGVRSYWSGAPQYAQWVNQLDAGT